MRKVIVSTYATLDGKVDDLRDWVTPYDADAVAGYHTDLLANSDGLLLGRKTYEVFATIWPPRAGGLPYADKINSMAKYVASGTLQASDLTWQNSHLINGNGNRSGGSVAEGVAKLKHQDGQDLVVYGGPTLINDLQQNDLIDEYRILLHPVLIGKGRTLLNDNAPRVDLALIDTSVISPGVVVLTYRPVR